MKVRFENQSCSGVDAKSIGIGYLPPYSTGDNAKVVDLPDGKAIRQIAILKQRAPFVVVEIIEETVAEEATSEVEETDLQPEEELLPSPVVQTPEAKPKAKTRKTKNPKRGKSK